MAMEYEARRALKTPSPLGEKVADRPDEGDAKRMECLAFLPSASSSSCYRLPVSLTQGGRGLGQGPIPYSIA